MALTFDLCEQPHEVAGYDSAIIDYLRETKTKATFFAGGKWIVNHELRAQQLIADPLFEVGNHTWEHRNLRLLRGQELENEIIGAQLAYSKVNNDLVRKQCIVPNQTNRVRGLPAPAGQPWLFRFPFGACDPESLRAVGDAGLLTIQWDVSSGDPMRSLSATQMAQAVLRDVRPGSIVLFHANGRGWQTAQALRMIVPELVSEDSKHGNYELVTVSDLLNTADARPVISPTCYDARPGDTNRYDKLARALETVYEAFKLTHGPPTHSNRGEGSPQELVVPPKPVPAVRQNLVPGRSYGGDNWSPGGR